MAQLILVNIIIVFAIAYAIYALVKYLRKKNDPCEGCDGCDLKKEITQNLKKKADKNPKTCGCCPKKE
ncbi:MAG: FeoB-associated Cys-rich membrane protein [Paludibacteraceae bacterium]|nr:FeoB-associated Cys-rich membrane protein [Paludibacteraceae bacterium]